MKATTILDSIWEAIFDYNTCQRCGDLLKENWCRFCVYEHFEELQMDNPTRWMACDQILGRDLFKLYRHLCR